jgi:uncharacterized membrane protein YfcA
MSLSTLGPLEVALLVLVGLVAGTIGGVVGFGSGVLLLPVVAWTFGPVQAVPILTVASLIGNVSRAALYLREIDWRVVGYYSAGAVPAATLGALVFVRLESHVIPIVFGAFVVVIVPVRRWAEKHELRAKLRHFPLVGAALGFLSGLVSTTGPINAPFFLSFGLVRGAYLATEATSTALVHATKSVVYGKFAALTSETIVIGIALGTLLLVGSYQGKRIVERVDAARFVLIVEVALVVSGVVMLAQGALAATK